MNTKALTNLRSTLFVKALFLLLIFFTNRINAEVHTVSVTLISGATEQVLSQQPVGLYEQLNNGTEQKIQSLISNNQGIISLSLSGLNQGQRYFLKTSNPFDSRTWRSKLINSASPFTFTIGNKLLHISVSSGVNNSPLANQIITLYQLLNDGSRKGLKTYSTDNIGQLALDLPGLGTDTSYELKALPRHGSRAVYSGEIDSTGNFTFIVGNVRVRAIEGRTNNTLSNHKVSAYKQNNDGSATYFSHANTDTSGFADFQLPDLANQSFIFKSVSPSDGHIWKSQTISTIGVTDFIIGNKLLNVTVTSGIDNIPLTNQKITLYQLLTDGSRKGLRTLLTDKNGLLTLDLAGLDNDISYELKTLPKHGSRVVYSGAISSTGNFAFNVANVRVKAIDGKTQKSIANHKVSVYKKNQDGSTTFFINAITDNTGFADFQLPDLANQSYILKALSLSDGRNKMSQIISTPGSIDFFIGNKLLNVTVMSGVDNIPLPNQAVTLYQLLNNGSRKGLRTLTTNINGQLFLDLPGLGTDTNYELKTLPKHGTRIVYSGEINATGNFSFKVANVRVKATNGQTNDIIVNHKITVYKQNPDGSTTYFTHSTTDNLGFTDFQLPNLGTQSFIFKAISLSDGRIQVSPPVSTAGMTDFIIGNQLLNVLVTNGIDNTPLANQNVTLYQLLNDNSREKLRILTTNNAGVLSLDLPGLGTNTSYELKTLPKHGSSIVYSGEINATGNFTFKVANVRVKAIDGQTHENIANHKINVYKQNQNGSTTYLTNAITDNSGFADFQLPNLANQSYVFEALSLSDGRTKKSQTISTTGSFDFFIGNELLNVVVTSGVDNTPLANQTVTLYQLLNNGSRQGLRTLTTDIDGLLTLDLPGLGTDTNYELKTLPRHGSRVVYSGTINATGNFTFKVANVRIKAINGQTHDNIANHKINVYKQNQDGSTTYLTNAITDNSGFADFQLPNLASQSYVFEALSLSDGRTKKSQTISTTGSFDFFIGNELLNVTVTSGVDNTPLANQAVTLYQLLNNGSRQGLRTLTTDIDGLLSLDLPGLGADTNYELKTLPRHGSRVIYSGKINATGNFTFEVANVRVKAIDGHTHENIENHKINVYKQNQDGSTTYLTNSITDSSGFTDFQLPNLANQSYIFEALSLSDGQTKKSQTISKSGSIDFFIGNKLLNVIITSGVDNTPLANQSVTLYQLLNNGSREGLRTLTTDINGLLTLDLPGLGTDTNYELKTLPKHGSRVVYSGEINATGNFTFKVANVRVKAIDGQTHENIANHKINVYKQNQDGSTTYLTNANTDNSGFADFQLPNLANQPYIFEALSLSDGRTKKSQTISMTGSFDFFIGNKILNVAVTSGVDNTALANQSLTLYKILNDGSREGFRTLTSDSNGFLSLDLPGLGKNTKYELKTLPKHGSRAVYSGEINSTQNFDFKVANVRVKAIDGKTNDLINTHKITVYKLSQDGSETWFSYAITDASGQADFFLPNLELGQQYIYKANSLSDGLNWQSEVISSMGISTFTIGNKLLNVAVTSGVDNIPLAQQDVKIFQLLNNGTRQEIRIVTTNNEGMLSLDLPGLGGNTNYELKTLPKHGDRAIYSGEINATGDFDFKVANIRVKAIDGRVNNSISNHKINVYKQNPDGSATYFTNANTNNLGFVDFQLPNITNQQYILKAASLSDGSSWDSQVISTPGPLTFVIGNKLLNVTVTSGIDQTPLTNQNITLFQLLNDGSRKGLQTFTTDSNGQLTLNLPGLGIDTSYELKTLPKYGDRIVYSGKINTTGNFAFEVANVRVKTINGRTNQIISGHKVSVYLRNSDGSDTWFSSTNSDDQGFIDFQLPNLNTGQQYIYKATSLSDGRTWQSEIIKTEGESNFVIGNKLLNFSLTNALSNNPLPNIAVSVYLRMPDNSLQWTQKGTTNTEGNINFDLVGLGSGNEYVLTSKPYGIKLSSEDIDKTGAFNMQAGAISVTLRNKKDSLLIQNQKLSLYEQTALGNIEWRAASFTNNNGKVHFDPTGLGTGKTYLIFGKNIFGNNHNYYSPWIVSKGVFDFIVDPDDLHKLDEEAPVFSQVHPIENATLADKGFLLKMQVTDNFRVDSVNVKIIDPVKGISSAQATQLNNEWVLPVTAAMITQDQIISIEAEAIDHVGNKSNANYQYSIINDTEKPLLTIISHENGDQINKNGFFLTGRVTDNTGFVSLIATIRDPVEGAIIKQKELEIGKTNHWALLAKDLPKNQDITIELQATDSAENVATDQLSLSVMTESSNMIQLINRITYGVTPELLKELRTNGSENFIQQQLHPELLDDSALEQQLAELLLNEASAFRKLHYSQISRAVSSKRQLLEIMTQFWESHFNTDLEKVSNTEYEKFENNQFRLHALGNFRDLLEISATSPAMLRYLDNIANFKDAPNENYARELMELHTLGVDNTYTSEDIKEVARVFTGWRISLGNFYFDKHLHDDDEKIVLGTIIPAESGVSGGQIVLDLLANHDATAQFICTKLLKVFVSDSPSTDAINQCATDYLNNLNEDNQIAIILEGIFHSIPFSDSLNFHNKVKTPLELIVGLYRQLPISVNYSKTRSYLNDMSMPLFYYPLPTGWPETYSDLINSNQLIQRWQLTNSTIFNTPSLSKIHIVDPDNYLIDKGIETTEGVLGYLFEIILAHHYSELEWTEALSILTNNQTEKFDIYAPEAELKIRNLMAFMLQYPTYQLQ